MIDAIIGADPITRRKVLGVVTDGQVDRSTKVRSKVDSLLVQPQHPPRLPPFLGFPQMIFQKNSKLQ